MASPGIANPMAHTQGYFVNEHAASPAEVQQVACYGAQPGHWRDGQSKPAATGSSAHKCWCVLGVKFCC